jgi:ferredoxin
MEPKKIIQSLTELPTMPYTIGTMEWNQTGDWRYLTPVAENKPAPCLRNCPAGIPIPDYLNAINQGDLPMALSLLLSHNPFPGLTGRLCYHPCQTQCTRKKIDRTISIQEIERLMSELGREIKIKENKKSDRLVTIIGSGPLGLSCAFFLGRQGVRVKVLEVNRRAGGALLGLSEKKLETQILEDEISRLARLADIEIQINAVFDFTGGRLPFHSDLVILDPTGVTPGPVSPAGSVSFDPWVDEEAGGPIIAVTLPENLEPFKASMIAHYIAAGRRTAEKALGRLKKSPEDDKGVPGPERLSSGEGWESNQIMDHPLSIVSIDRGPKPERTGPEERILEEAGRCLYCGTCNLCLQCFSSCPESCIRVNDQKVGITVDLDFCKGCGLCAYECPRGVIAMEEVGP